MADVSLRLLEQRWKASGLDEDLLVYCQACQRAGYTDQTIAQMIMGKNYLGLDAVAKHFGELSDEQMIALVKIPFRWETLIEHSETHILVADIGLSPLKVREKARRGLFYSYEDSWYNAEEFAQETGKACWRLISKTPVENSTMKMLHEQNELIPDTDEIPSARQVIYMVILHDLATGERLFENLHIRTNSFTSSAHSITVGLFEGNGLHIDNFMDSYRNSTLGVSSAVRPDLVD